MADSRALLRPAQLLALVKELRRFEEGAAVDPEGALEIVDGPGAPGAPGAYEVHEREHHSGSVLGG